MATRVVVTFDDESFEKVEAMLIGTRYPNLASLIRDSIKLKRLYDHYTDEGYKTYFQNPDDPNDYFLIQEEPPPPKKKT